MPEIQGSFGTLEVKDMTGRPEEEIRDYANQIGQDWAMKKQNDLIEAGLGFQSLRMAQTDKGREATRAILELHGLG